MSTVNQSSTPTQTIINNFLQFDPETELVTSKLNIHKKPTRTDLAIYTLSCGCLGTTLEKIKRYDLAKVRIALEKRVKTFLEESDDKAAAVKTAREVYTKFNTLFDRVNEKREADRRYDTKIRFEKNTYEPRFEELLLTHNQQDPTPAVNTAKDSFSHLIPDSQENPFPTNPLIKKEEESCDSSSNSSPAPSDTNSSQQVEDQYEIDDFVVDDENDEQGAISASQEYKPEEEIELSDKEEEIEEEIEQDTVQQPQEEMKSDESLDFSEPVQQEGLLVKEETTTSENLFETKPTEVEENVQEASDSSEEEAVEEAASSSEEEVEDDDAQTAAASNTVTPATAPQTSTTQVAESWSRGTRLRNTPPVDYSKFK